MQDDGLSRADMEVLLDTFPSQPLDFYGALRSATKIERKNIMYQKGFRSLINFNPLVNLLQTLYTSEARAVCAGLCYNGLGYKPVLQGLDCCVDNIWCEFGKIVMSTIQFCDALFS